MDNVEFPDLWRQIPPEEKLEVMSRAHARGFLSALVTIIIGATLAVGFQANWLLWGSFLISIFVFQFAAGRAWRTLRPIMLLEYLAARSATRRYAFTANSKELSVVQIFRGTLEEQFDKDHEEDALNAAIENVREAAVWVALFRDAVVMIAECPGGASLKLGHVLDDKLEVTARSVDGKEYSTKRELIFQFKDRLNKTARRCALRSKYSAALAVFEKRVLAFQQEQRVKAANLERLALTSGGAPAALPEAGEVRDIFMSFDSD